MFTVSIVYRGSVYPPAIYILYKHLHTGVRNRFSDIYISFFQEQLHVLVISRESLKSIKFIVIFEKKVADKGGGLEAI